MNKISAVIPIYRSEKSIYELYSRLITSLSEISDDFEIIMVEDCGGDNSWDVICDIAGVDERVIGIKMTRNFGQHAATICGIEKAIGDWIITLDDDLEQYPEDIISLYKKALEGYDLVYGVYEERTHSSWRNITSEIARRLFKMAIPNLNDQYTSFRIIRASIAKNLILFDSPFPFVDGYLSWITNNYAFVKVEHGERKYGESNYKLRKLITHTINIFVTFSDIPLKIATWIGLSSSVIGFVWLFIILLGKILGDITVSGYTSIIASIIFFGGLQMFVLGILGEYIGRINFKTSRKPLYLVSSIINEKEKSADYLKVGL
jgi:glycosyltransferase involved in cell wall biosynthesis